MNSKHSATWMHGVCVCVSVCEFVYSFIHFLTLLESEAVPPVAPDWTQQVGGSAHSSPYSSSLTLPPLPVKPLAGGQLTSTSVVASRQFHCDILHTHSNPRPVWLVV